MSNARISDLIRVPPEIREKLILFYKQKSKQTLEKSVLCLIGSWARGEQTELSDYDLLLIHNHLKKIHPKFGWINDKPASIFFLSAPQILKQKKTDFLTLNNIFEAKPLFGDTQLLTELQEKTKGKSIDYKKTKILLCMAFRNRLLASITSLPYEPATPLRELKTCLTKLALYKKLFNEKINPWKIIPYKFTPKTPLEKTIIKLTKQKTNKIEPTLEKINLNKLLEETFHTEKNTIQKIINNTSKKAIYKTFKKVFLLHLLVEEEVRRSVFPNLSARTQLTAKNINHLLTEITYHKTKPKWVVHTEHL